MASKTPIIFVVDGKTIKNIIEIMAVINGAPAFVKGDTAIALPFLQCKHE